MKIRNGFVANSSSSSFTVDLTKISHRQKEQILDHETEGEKLGMVNCDCPWHVEEKGTRLELCTSMTNFDMLHFVRMIGIHKTAILEYDADYGYASLDAAWARALGEDR